MKQPISAFEKAGEICEAMKRGVLLTTGTLDKPNTMTIGWGMIGVEWGKPMFLGFVRVSRYTREMLDQTGDFTVNIPAGEFDSKILGFCGTKSGRNVNKFEALDLTPVPGNQVQAPGIAELPLTLECKVLHQQLQDLAEDVDPSIAKYYPTDEYGNRDLHILYFAEIVDAYIITE